MAFESEPELPEYIEFKWRSPPTAVPARQPGESQTAYYLRSNASYGTLPSKSERIEVRDRIPQEVRDEINGATRNALPHKLPSSVIYLHFIWTDSGVKLHWRLKRSKPDGTLMTVRDGGDELP